MSTLHLHPGGRQATSRAVQGGADIGTGRRQWGADAGSPAWILAPVVVLGVLLRLVEYLRDPSVWHDEAALLVSVVERGVLDLLGSLTYAATGSG